MSERVREATHSAVRKSLVVAIALIGGWILFKIILAAATALLWTGLVILAIVAIVYVLFFW
jgi:fatty acid desaturase